MSKTTVPRSAFTLRFRNENTHRALRLTSEILGVSMNELAEAAIAHELATIGADLEQKLTQAAELLRSYRGEGIDDDVETFAEAEATVDDPLRSRMVAADDSYGIGALFARPLEQRRPS